MTRVVCVLRSLSWVGTAGTHLGGIPTPSIGRSAAYGLEEEGET